MKDKTLTLFICLALLSSCNDQQPEAKSTIGPHTSGTADCYRYVNNKDTVLLTLSNKNESITGTLMYNLYEKDKNTGTIRGKLKGNLVIVDYTFNAEGSTSVRQVVFKQTGETLTEGYGQTREENGRSVFLNIDSLKFGQSIVLTKINCDK